MLGLNNAGEQKRVDGLQGWVKHGCRESEY